MKPIPPYVLALAMAIPALLVGIEIPTWRVLGSQNIALQSDFRVFYTPGYMLRTGQRKQIYDFAAIRRNQDTTVAADGAAVPFLHPAYEAVIFVPLSLLPYHTAYLVWAGVNFLALGLTFVLLRHSLPDISALSPQWVVPALLLGFMPVAFAILSGQDSLFLLLILVMVYRRLASSELQAGMLLGLGMFRFQVLLPIIALFLVWRGLKFVAGWVVGSAVVMSASAAVTGVAAQIQYVRLLHQMSRISLWLLIRRMPNLRGLFEAWHLGVVPLALASLLCLLAAAVVGARQSAQQKLLLTVSLSTLVTYYLFMHDLSVLALPLLLAINQAIARRAWLSGALAAVALSGFALFWLARDSFYLGALFTLLFLVTQIAAAEPLVNGVESSRTSF